MKIASNHAVSGLRLPDDEVTFSQGITPRCHRWEQAARRCISFILVSGVAGLFSAPMPDVSLSNPGWKWGPGVSLSDGVITLEGDAGTTRSAQLCIPVYDLGNQDFYLVGEVRTMDLVPGPTPYAAPKFKVTHGNDTKTYLASTISGVGTGGEWIVHHLKYAIPPGKPTETLLIELAIQQCSGRFEVRDLRLSMEPPKANLDFPWRAPTQVRCILPLKQAEMKPFNNRLLGMNSHFVSTASLSYQRPDVVDLIARLRMPVLRFPGGTVANWYDYETDGFRIPPKGEPFVTFAIPEKTFGYLGYEALCKAHGIESIQVFNVIQDSPERSAARLRFLKGRGLPVRWVELGNENHAKTQQGGSVKSVEGYIQKTKEVVKALKQVDPNILYAVNIDHVEDEHWAIPLSRESYYDAVVMHPYIFLGVGPKLGWSENLIRAMFSAYGLEKQLLSRYRQVFGKRPLLLSEWGIIAPMETLFTQIATLGTADQFLAILDESENGLVQMASIHIFYGKYMGLYDVDENDRPYKRSYGVLFEMIQEAFRDGQLYKARSESDELVAGIPGVLARGIRGADGVLRVFAVNKWPKAVPLDISCDGKPKAGKWKLDSFSQEDFKTRRNYGLTENPRVIQEGQGKVNLPPYSISVLSYPLIKP